MDVLCHLGPILTRPQPEDGAFFLSGPSRLDEIERKLDQIQSRTSEDCSCWDGYHRAVKFWSRRAMDPRRRTSSVCAEQVGRLTPSYI
jgi:hypothetical protein